MKQLKIENFGPIHQADVYFGDLTLLVGPQASGKSIFVQLLKLLIDKQNIKDTFQKFNYVWEKNYDSIISLYFGEGMHKVWHDDSIINLDGRSYRKDFLLPKQGRVDKKDELLFYIPAQRILSVSDGRPKYFTEFDTSTPYVLRQFSETLRLIFQNDIQKNEFIFPLNKRLKEPLRKSFNDSIFHDGKIIIEEQSGQRKLKMNIEGMNIPFMSWSAGQKEFLPLLLGFYWLCPPSKVNRKNEIKYVVIEEPEMGLHPQAIKSVILQIIDLLSRNYKVVVSTHSPVLLEFAWAFNLLKHSKVDETVLCELFDIKNSPSTKNLFNNILLGKTINTFYFSRTENKIVTKDISDLDVGNDDESIAEWGGISQFAGKTANVVSRYF